MIMQVLQVALGGAVGAALRFVVLQGVAAPWGVMSINVLGSFLIGLLVVPASRWGVAPLVIAGVLGGFTTFSAFSLDALRLWQAGALAQAMIYVMGSVVLSLLAVAAGGWLFQALQERGSAS